VIVIVSGPGGVGKGTIVAELIERDPRLWSSRSWTTRPRRPDEPADAYHFVDREAFRRRVDADGFVEWTEFAGNGHLYGTPTLDPPEGRDALLEIELDGATQVKRRYPEAILILIVAPSREDQELRLRRRGDDEDSVARRVEVGAREQELGLKLADHVVVNADVDRATEEVLDILATHRSGRTASAAGPRQE
jgi:guanylate kinase